MAVIFNIINSIFGILFYPFENLNPAWGMIWISLTAGVLMLIIFRFTSNQEGIKKSKAKVSAYILEMRLFNHDLGKMLASLGRTLGANLVYLRFMLVPLVFIIIPVLIVLIQTGYRYENRPLKPGEAVIVKAILKKDFSVVNTPVELKAPDGVVVETGALRIGSLNEVDWRISSQKAGNYELVFYVNGKEYGKNLHAGEGLSVLSAERAGPSFSSLMLNHSESRLPDDSPFISLYVSYPDRVLKIMGFEFHWIIWFFIFSVIFSFAFKGIFKVEL
ncbi:MAG: hypothetical protein HY757_01355 [Nitrospirae bacterium]|nr:hypothetical protein [Nitrospirota bacterium]